jgi:hypothetical protein
VVPVGASPGCLHGVAGEAARVHESTVPANKRIEQNARRYNRPKSRARLLMRNNVSLSPTLRRFRHPLDRSAATACPAGRGSLQAGYASLPATRSMALVSRSRSRLIH